MRFNTWLHSIADTGRDLLFRRYTLEKHTQPHTPKSIEVLCEDLYSSRGEALGTALAREVVHAYKLMSDRDKFLFFSFLLCNYSVNRDKVFKCFEDYKQSNDHDSLQALIKSVEAPRQDLLRRINIAPSGTQTIVTMRRDLLELLPSHPELAVVESDFRHLLNSWFNRGFLTLKRINWKTPGDILEKLITYEAVHAMKGWDDLRRRLADDRRCYAFFHPALSDEPLIFVQVALVNGLADSVQELLDPCEQTSNGYTDTAIFYSISDCQKGLKDISFGNFLIKQVVMELRSEVPTIKQFATLSPIPGFKKWLDIQLADPPSNLVTADEANLISGLNNDSWHKDLNKINVLKPILIKLCARYLYFEKKQGKPIDPVARFHLRNGAAIGRLNWLGDVSPKGLSQSAGMLVNYCYNLNQVEKNHESYVNRGDIAVLDDFISVLKNDQFFQSSNGRLTFIN